MFKLIAAAVIAVAMPAVAQEAPRATLPAETVIQVTPVAEITSKHMHEGETRMLQVVSDVSYGGAVVIPRGAPVKALVTWRTGKAVGGKSAKFELTFKSVTVGGRDFALHGTHRQEGGGNTLVAVLVFAGVSGHSAVMQPGQIATAFTAEPIPAI